MNKGRAIRASVAAGMLALLSPCGLMGPLLSGCSPREPAVPPADQIYSVRGRITGLPVANKPLSELTILHEPIPSFVRQDGTLGMDSMEMPFAPAKSLSLAGLAVGDVVEFTFEVRWKARPFSQVTRITKLPPGTPINLGTANGGQ